MVEYPIVFVESGHCVICVLLISEVQDILSYHFSVCITAPIITYVYTIPLCYLHHTTVLSTPTNSNWDRAVPHVICYQLAKIIY